MDGDRVPDLRLAHAGFGQDVFGFDLGGRGQQREEREERDGETHGFFFFGEVEGWEDVWEWKEA